MLRKHQRDFGLIIDDIIGGVAIEEINIVATPGAGKSSLPIQATRLITAGLADAVAWLVPRSALQSQGERGFMDPFFMEMFDHNYLIRSSTNDSNPCRGTNGFVTTYQAVASDKEKTVLREIKSKRYILFLDEFHHLEKKGVWHDAVNEMVENCEFLVKMTGTLGRGDKKPIAYIDYSNSRPVFREGDGSRLITYPRTDALREKAILPIKFFLNDGEFSWKDRKGIFKQVVSFNDAKTPKDRTAALFTALHSEFFTEILTESVLHWREWKKHRPSAKLLIVTADHEGAQKALEVLRKINIKAEIATSHKPIRAIKHINFFKSNRLDCLVTIAMAYEGLDVPEISHIAALTNIRSREWIEQMLARGVRIDKAAGPYETQLCHVFAPQDKRLNKVVDLVKKEQLSAIQYFSEIKKDEEDLEKKEFEEDDMFPEMSEKQEIEPISSRLTDKSELLLGHNVEPGGKNSLYNMPIKTIKEQEQELRREIHKHMNIFCLNNRYKPAKLNSEIKDRFGKARDLMTLLELQKLSKFVVKYYPIDGRVISYTEGVSRKRGGGKRVTTKIKKWTSCSDILEKYNVNPIRDLIKN